MKCLLLDGGYATRLYPLTKDRPNPLLPEAVVPILHRICEHMFMVDYEEKPPKPRTTLISVGLYYFGKAHLPLFRQYLEEGHSKDAPGFYLQWFFFFKQKTAYEIDGEWYDIGDIDSYNAANEMMMK